MRNQQTDTGEQREVKGEKERGNVQRTDRRTGVDKSRGNTLGERPGVFYCALMLRINAIINREPLN